MSGDFGQLLRSAAEASDAGRFEDAADLLAAAAERDAGNAGVWHALAAALHGGGHDADAEIAWRQALELRPDHAAAAAGLAGLLARGGRFEDAIALAERAARADPANATAHANLGAALAAVGRLEPAQAALETAIAIDPSHADALSNLALLLERRGLFADAERRAREALRADPSHAAASNHLARLMERDGQLDAAVELWRQILRQHPADPTAWTNLASALSARGEVPEAIEAYRRAVAADPGRPQLRSNLLLTLHCDPRYSPQDLLREHLEYARAVSPQPPPAVSPPVPRDRRGGDGRIRVAYVSAAFRRHAVACFMRGVLRHHDRSRFRITCYSDVLRPDEYTAEMRAAVECWHETAYLRDAELRDLVRSGGEDVVVDLSGHLPRNRLPALAERCAPVQVTYLGYQNTTGLPAMDYRVTDAVADPPGQTDHLHVETLARLSCFFAYHPAEEAPDVTPLPADRAGRVSFGSLNNPTKFSPPAVELWARILRRVPGSTLTLLSSAAGRCEERLVEAFSAHGIGADRLHFHRRGGYPEYLAAYGAIDVALDPLPFSGHTTTCDGLWMGVPVVTLVGSIYVSRMTASVLTHLRLPELIATDREGYVETAAALVGDLPRLRELRATLRERMRSSRVTDSRTFTAELEAAYERFLLERCGPRA